MRKLFTMSDTKNYCKYQALVLERYVRMYHVSELVFVQRQAVHFDLKHHVN